MTVIFSGTLDSTRFNDVQYFRILGDTVYFNFFDGSEITKKNIKIIGALA